ncbi:hypothetical protein AALP_AAs48252U001600 [Arabis alpina]|uniref:Uncharacterized protein n=1 Tax=Arabis alpina TaxID=50452 RepID=A0A087FWG4_ARAAL|nr:hypothetical protein AALP_AAs48252U001600 [Arabis alpina]
MPWPGRGHINPLMNLCKRLVRRDPNLLVTFVVTEEWFGLIGNDPKPDRIHFATLPNLIPSEIVRADDFIGFIEAVFTRLEEPFEQLLDSLNSPSPTAIIADTNVLWAVSVGTRRNIPVASFWTTSATILSLSLHSDLLATHGHFLVEPSGSKEDEIVDYIPGLSPTRLGDLRHIFHGYSHEVFNKFKKCYDELSKANYLLFPSAYELETKAIDFFTSKFDFPVYAMGPLIPFEEFSVANNSREPDYIRWLNDQQKSSVIYISQGSFLSASEAQMEEIVEGVKESRVPFLWVARGAESKLNEALEGSLGVVVSWCDQLRVLCHAAMIVEEWRVGMRIESKKEKEKKTELVIRRAEIKELVKRFMDGEFEEGKDMRRRACALGDICRQAVAESGSSDVNIDAFISDITKIV